MAFIVGQYKNEKQLTSYLEGLGSMTTYSCSFIESLRFSPKEVNEDKAKMKLRREKENKREKREKE
ncbi:hypothetical protein CR513_15398, partial [Mucuna pruriens]